MRKLLIVAAMAAAALGSAAACTQGTPASTTTTTTAAATTTGADETAAVCTEALATQSTNSAQALAKVNEAMQAASSGQLDKIPAIKTQIEGIVATWKTKFTELSGKSIKPEVKTVLTDTVTFLDQLAANANNPTALGDAQTKLTELSGRLTTACA